MGSATGSVSKTGLKPPEIDDLHVRLTFIHGVI